MIKSTVSHNTIYTIYTIIPPAHHKIITSIAFCTRIPLHFCVHTILLILSSITTNPRLKKAYSMRKIVQSYYKLSI